MDPLRFNRVTTQGSHFAIALITWLLIGTCGCQVTDRMSSENADGQLTKSHSRSVTVLGKVRHPGVFELPPLQSFTLQKAIAMAGGFGTPDLMISGINAESAMNAHDEYVRGLALCLKRGVTTYIIPCECIEATELGEIHMIADDVLSVVTWESLRPRVQQNEVSQYLVNGLVESPGPRSVSDSVSFPAANLFRVSTAAPGSAGSDFLSSARLLRLTRNVTADGLPRVFVLPILDQKYDGDRSEPPWYSLGVQGGDVFTYLPAGGDPLLLASVAAESQLRRRLRQLSASEDELY